MAQEKSTPSLVVRVLQGIILGAVLAIPVVLWGLSRADAPAVEAPPEASGATQRKAAKRVKPGVARRPAAPKAKEAETIPAARMHLRIDDGSRPVPQGVPVPSKEDIE